MVVEILRFFLLSGLLILAVLTISVIVTVFKQGPAAIADLDRRGFGFWSWISGSMPSHRDGTSIDVIEGLEIEAEDGKLTRGRPTCAVSADD